MIFIQNKKKVQFFDLEMMDSSEVVKGREGFIDRSKVRILLCDNDTKSSDEVFNLLCKCSYQGEYLLYFDQFRLPVVDYLFIIGLV